MPKTKARSTSRAKTRKSSKTSVRKKTVSRRSVAKFASVTTTDIDRVVREEVTEWFTSNRKGLETVFRRVADQVRDELDTAWSDRLEEEREKLHSEVRKLAEEKAGLAERNRNLEEEIKRMRGVLTMVRSQVAEESGVD